MRLAHDLLRHQFLRGFRVRCQVVKFFLGAFWLDHEDLFLDALLDGVLELSLDGLRRAEDVPELLRERPMHRLLHPRLRLVFVFLLRLHDVVFHEVQVRLQLLEVLLIALDDAIQLRGFDCAETEEHGYIGFLSGPGGASLTFLIGGLVVVDLLVGDVLHLIVVRDAD